jgi:EAL domain-containing protein (putative c-di-GMP-specific phosphodiesterase class I)/GGDEF domain-containing protein
MATDNLLEALPELVLLLQHDGTVLAICGGRSVTELKPGGACLGKPVDSHWPEPLAKLVMQLTHDALARGATMESTLQHAGHHYEIRVGAQGADVVICTIRAAADESPAAPEGRDGSRCRLDRRGLMRRFRELISVAALRNTAATVAVVQIDGVTDIEQLISVETATRIMRAAILRLRPLCEGPASPPWTFLGQLGDNQLLLVLATVDRTVIEACIAQVCSQLSTPITIDDVEFSLTPHAGVAILGQDGSSPKTLLRHASTAVTEARRARAPLPRFYSDVSELAVAAPLDIARDLREAISNGDIRLRYIGRHDLATGRLVAWVGYLQWHHRVYGRIQPIELLRLAEVMGLTGALSLAVMKRLKKDFVALARHPDPRIRVSFAPPRQHLTHEGFIRDIERFLADGVLPAARLELRISVKASHARSPADFDSLARRGVQLVVDEIGRGMDFPLDWLGRAPMSGLLLNRSWVSAVVNDSAALKMCRASAALAKALGWTPIAVGIDGAVQRETLLELGCEQGTGELYGESLQRDFADDMTASPPPSGGGVSRVTVTAGALY